MADDDEPARPEWAQRLRRERIARNWSQADAVQAMRTFSAVPLPDGRSLQQLAIGGRTRLVVAGVGRDPAALVESNEDTSGPLTLVGTSDVAFMMFEPELRLSWRQPLGNDGFFFIEPGVAAGAAIGWLDVSGSADPATGGDADFTDTDASFQWKVFLRAGLPFSTGLAGIEASYMSAGRLEFADDIRGDPSEFYVGIFGAIQF